MQFTTRTIRYALVASVGVLAACDKSDLQTAPQTPVVSLAPSLAVELSNPTATSGDRIAIAIANTSALPIGSVQGRLRFNPSQLVYRGQTRDADDRAIMVVNDADAATGTLRVAILDPANLARSAAMVFDVIGEGYASSISFVPEEVATNGPTVKVLSGKVTANLAVNSGLQAPVDAERLSINDWYAELTKNEAALEPGMIVNGLKFGDTNGNGVIQLADALYVVNVSVGGNELIIGTDGTGPNGVQDGVVAGNVVPANIDGGANDLGEAGDPNPPGVETNGTRLLTLADALAIVNESVGSLQPVVGEIIPGRPTTPVTSRTVVSANITTNTTWTPSTIYELSGRITVTNGATLTIEAGTRVEGQRPVGTAGGSYLVIARDGQINAQGTPLQPIVFTCTLNAGETPRSKGCWGGVSVLGNAHVNETGSLTSPVIAGRAATGGCREASAEGGAGLYGGCNDDDNSGTIRYVRLEYPGFRFNAENELNGLALYGVGRGTTVSHVQVHAGLDDAVEMFGGTVNMKYLYMTATSDDAFDFTFGWDGKAQYIIAQHDATDSDNGFENDNATTNLNALPRAVPSVYNVTLVGQRNNRAGVSESQNRGLLIRRGTRPHYFNFHVEGYTTALTVANDETCVDFGTSTGFELKNSTFALNQSPGGTAPAGCGGSSTSILAQGGNSTLTASPLLEPLSYLVPDFRPSSAAAVTGATPPADGFFDVAATYVGAVAPATATKNNAPWYSGWTRGWQNSTTP
jgi:hypothetical protein